MVGACFFFEVTIPGVLLNVMAADIQNAYLQAPSLEKHFIVCGPEFGLENIGKVALIK